MARSPSGTHPGKGRPPEPGEDVWDLFARVHGGLRRTLAGRLRPFRLLPSEYQALSLLARGPQTLGELGRALGLTPAAITDLTGRLRRRALLTRERNPKDARSTVVRLSPRGERSRQEAKATFRRSLRQVERRIPPPVLAELRSGLAELTAALGEAEAARPGPAGLPPSRPARRTRR